MSEDTNSDFDVPEITGENIVELDDEYFTTENVAIVTGAGSGIGQATTLCLAENGLTVLATGLDDLDETVSMGEDIGVDGEIVTLEADLTNDEDAEAIVEAAAEAGDIKYLANIAGLQHVESIQEFPMEQYDLMHDVMLRGPLYLTQLCWPHIEDSEDGVGAIGNMGSIHGHVATRDKAAYIMIKFGLRGLTQAIAAEGQGTIRGFSVSTGFVKTPLAVNQIPDTARERGISEQEVVENVMLGDSRTKEMMDPVEVGNLFVWGFSRHSKHLNGNDLLYDGGVVNTYL